MFIEATCILRYGRCRLRRNVVSHKSMKNVFILLILCTCTRSSFTWDLLIISSFFMHQSFVTIAPQPTGKGGDYDFSAFNALL